MSGYNKYAGQYASLVIEFRSSRFLIQQGNFIGVSDTRATAIILSLKANLSSLCEHSKTIHYLPFLIRSFSIANLPEYRTTLSEFKLSVNN